MRYGLIAAIGLALATMAGTVQAGPKDNSVKVAFDIAPENIDPYFNSARVGVIIAQQVWDTLLYRDPVTGEHKGQLAKSWRWVDERTLEFELRQGVIFQNGEAFDADDVVYTFNYVANPANKVVTQSNVAWIAGAEKIDPYTVQVKLKYNFPAAIEYLSGPVVIYPNEYHTAQGPQGMNMKPVGSGPYRIVEHVPGKSVRLQRNPDYFRDSPKAQPTIERIDIRFIPDRQTQVAELMTGGVEFAMGIPVDEAKGMKDIPTVQVVDGETMRVVFLNVNSQETSPTPALRDVRVRQAIAHAIDRKTMIRQLVGDKARVLDVVCYPSQFGCDASQAVSYEYNPAKAKALLAEAGYPNGFDVDIMAYREREQTEAIIGYLRAVGIRTNFRFLQYAAMREQVRAGKSSLVHQTWGSFGINDVSSILSNYFKFNGDDVNHSLEVRDLLQVADSSIDPNIRRSNYTKALGIISQQAYGIPLYSLPSYYVVSKGLSFTPYPDELPRFWEMRWK